MIRDEEQEQQDSKSYCRRPAPVRDPRSDKSAAKRSRGCKGKPGELHPERKSKSCFRLMIMRPPGSQRKILNAGDEDPGSEPGDNGGDYFQDWVFSGARI